MDPAKLKQKPLHIWAGLRMIPLIHFHWTGDKTTSSPETGVSWHLCYHQRNYRAEAPSLCCQRQLCSSRLRQKSEGKQKPSENSEDLDSETTSGYVHKTAKEEEITHVKTGGFRKRPKEFPHKSPFPQGHRGEEETLYNPAAC